MIQPVTLTRFYIYNPPSFSLFLAFRSAVMDTDDVLKVSTNNIHRVLFHIPQKFVRISKSKKADKLLELVETNLSKNQKIVIFSNDSKTSDFVQMFLNENNIECVNFNGAQHYKYRRDKLDRFITGEVRL